MPDPVQPTRRPITAEDLLRVKVVSDPQVSPDGTRVAYVVTQAFCDAATTADASADPSLRNNSTRLDKEADDYRSAIWVVPTDGGEPRQLTAGTARDTAPRWSPDGATVAFVSTRAPAMPPLPDPSPPAKPAPSSEAKPLPQIWLLPIAGGEARQLTNRPRGATDPVWSPDGAAIAFLSPTAPAEDPLVGPTRPEPAADERIVDDLRYRHDDRGYVDGWRSHVWRVPAAGGDPVRLTGGPHDDEQIAWSPDGATIVFVSNRSAGHERNMVSALYAVPAAGGEVRPLVERDARFHSPAWSPDGARLAFLGHERANENGRIERLWTVPAAGGEPTCLTAEWDWPVADEGMSDLFFGTDIRPHWLDGGDALLVLASCEGEVHAHRVPLAHGAPTPITRGRRRIAAAAPAAERLVTLAGDLAHPFELHVSAMDGSGERRLTDHNAKLLRRVILAEPEEFRVRASDGLEVQAWALRPPKDDGGAPLPAILQIHGGPHAMYGHSPFHELQLMAARGYLVLFANPRGSAGYGEGFATSTRARWGEADAPDVLAVVDAAVERGWADPARLGVCGGSYGGYLTNWLVGHDRRFAAAVTMRCVSNFHSFYGTSDIGFDFGEWEFGGTPWAAADLLLRHSPISYADKIETPLLIIHNENDLRCPIEQAEQLFVALKRLGRETRFVRIPEENHDLSRTGKPSRRLARLRHLLGWFDDRLAPGSTPDADPERP